MKDKTTANIIGVILLGAGLAILFKNAHVYSWGFYSMGRINTGPICLILLTISVLAYASTRSREALAGITVSLALLLLSLILGMHITFWRLSLLDVILILGMIGAGAGILVRTNLY